MYEETVSKSVFVATAIVSAVAVTRLNPAVADFFQNPFIIFLVITLYMYKRNKNILVSMSTAFFFTVFVGVVTMPEPVQKIKEAFGLIYPTTNVHPSCVKVTVADLRSAFNGNEEELKRAMDSSSVPYNLQLTDRDAPEIATYLVNNSAIRKITDECSL